jgi:hypothetical protein
MELTHKTRGQTLRAMYLSVYNLAPRRSQLCLFSMAHNGTSFRVALEKLGHIKNGTKT